MTLSKDEYNPQTQFFCYLCERIKDRAEFHPVMFGVGTSQWVVCNECSAKMDALRTFGATEKHPVLIKSEFVMVVGNDYHGV